MMTRDLSDDMKYSGIIFVTYNSHVLKAFLEDLKSFQRTDEFRSVSEFNVTVSMGDQIYSF